MLFIANRAIFNSWEGFKTRRYAPGVLFQTFEALSFLQNETTRFLKRFKFTNEETGFWSFFQVYKVKKHVFEVYNMKKHVFEASFIFTKWRNTFLECLCAFKFTKWRNTFLKFTNEETRFSSVFQVYKWRNTFTTCINDTRKWH